MRIWHAVARAARRAYVNGNVAPSTGTLVEYLPYAFVRTSVRRSLLHSENDNAYSDYGQTIHGLPPVLCPVSPGRLAHTAAEQLAWPDAMQALLRS